MTHESRRWTVRVVLTFQRMAIHSRSEVHWIQAMQCPSVHVEFQHRELGTERAVKSQLKLQCHQWYYTRATWSPHKKEAKKTLVTKLIATATAAVVRRYTLPYTKRGKKQCINSKQFVRPQPRQQNKYCRISTPMSQYPFTDAKTFVINFFSRQMYWQKKKQR